MQLDVCFSRRSLGLNPGLFYMRFLVEVVALKQFFFSPNILHFPKLSIIPSLLNNFLPPPAWGASYPSLVWLHSNQVESFVNFPGYSMVNFFHSLPECATFFFNLWGGTWGTAATTDLLYQPRMIGDGDCEEIGGIKTGRGNRSTRRNSAPAPLCPPQIPHD
jgi:hypothetical protein